jgi:hypothetical protein
MTTQQEKKEQAQIEQPTRKIFLSKTYQLICEGGIGTSDLMGELEDAIENIAGPYSQAEDEVANFILELVALLEKADEEDRRLILAFVESYAYQQTSHYLDAKRDYIQQLFQVQGDGAASTSTERADVSNDKAIQSRGQDKQ